MGALWGRLTCCLALSCTGCLRWGWGGGELDPPGGSMCTVQQESGRHSRLHGAALCADCSSWTCDALACTAAWLRLLPGCLQRCLGA